MMLIKLYSDLIPVLLTNDVQQEFVTIYFLIDSYHKGILIRVQVKGVEIVLIATIFITLTT